MAEIPQFSKREQDVVALLLQGRSNRQMAAELGISERTIEYHLRNIYTRLGVDSRTAAVIALGKSTGQPGVEPVEATVETQAAASDNQGVSSEPEKDPPMNPPPTPPPPFERLRIPLLASLAAIVLVMAVCLASLLAPEVAAVVRQRWRAIATQVIVPTETPEPTQTLPPVIPLPSLATTPTIDFTPTPEASPTFTPTPPDPVQYSQGLPLAFARTWHTATRLNNNLILLVGGSDGIGLMFSNVEYYSPLNNTFLPAAPLNALRHEHTATLLADNRVLVVGGYNPSQGLLADAEVFDPVLNDWNTYAPLFSHGVQHTSTRLLDGRVLVVGGCIAGGDCTARVELFDPATNTWTETTSLSFYRASHCAVLLNDGRVLVAGGSGPSGRPTDGDALLYDPQTGLWAATGPMNAEHVQAEMVKLLDGRVLVAGGINSSATPVAGAVVEIYDPATNAWTPVAPLPQPRYGFNLVLLPDGRLLAAGGALEYDFPTTTGNFQPWRDSSFVRSVDIYNPISNQWLRGTTLPKPFAEAAAVLLPDGRVWISGGGAGGSSPKAWADTWFLSP